MQTTRRFLLSLLLAFSGTASANTLLLYEDGDAVNTLLVNAITLGVEEVDQVTPVATLPTRILLDTDSVLDQHDFVIVLGESLVDSYVNLNINLPWIGGLISRQPETDIEADALSTNVDPHLIFSSIDALTKDIDTIFTVATDDIDPGYLKQAEQAAMALGMTLVIQPSNSRKSTARAWFNILKTIHPASEAIWISDQQFLESTGSFKYVNETSWKQRVATVSTIPSHSNRGVTVGFDFDMRAYGKLLAERVQTKALALSKSSIDPFPPKALTIHFNRRSLVNQNQTPPNLASIADVPVLLR